MEKILRNLKEKMDKTILREIRFEEKHKQNIWKAVRLPNNKEPKLRNGILKQRLNVLLSTGVSCALLLGTVFIAGKQMGFLEESHSKSQVSPDDTSMVETTNGTPDFNHRDQWKNDQDFLQGRNSAAIGEEYPEKFKIVKKMYYSWDYIDNAQGEYIYTMYPNGNVTKVEFFVDFVNERRYSKREIMDGNKVIETTNSLLTNDTITRQLVEKKLYTKETVQDDPNTQIDEAQRMKDQFLMGAGPHVTSSELYAYLRDNYENWEYEEAEKFGMTVYQIEGIIPETHSERLQGAFSMTISKSTGALLDFKAYGKDGSDDIIFEVTVNEVKINEGIEHSVFQLDVSGSKRVPFEEYNMNTFGMKGWKEKPGGVDTSNKQ